MAVQILVGAQWGDEGKGKVVDSLSKDIDFVVRFAGGNNAGHTICVNNEKFVLHLLPSGVLYSKSTCILSSGIVFDPKVFLGEIEELEKRGFSTKHILISKRAHLIMPYHVLLDCLWENFKGDGKIGTTKRGIGPCYSDKYDRIGIRVGDLLNPNIFMKKLEKTLFIKNEIITKIFGKKALDLDEIFKSYMMMAKLLEKRIINSEELLKRAIDNKKNILLEGAQGMMLDIDFGHFPYVTSSSPTTSGACVGSGIAYQNITKSIGVCKAYATRVGEGPFITELDDEIGNFLRKTGNEYGSTTKRPRRCGWLDLVALNHAVFINGLTDIALTKLDILTGLKEIKICIKYKLDNNEIDYIPDTIEENVRSKPVYITLPGWQEDISKCKNFDDLPKNAKNFIIKIETLVNCKISFISTGMNRDEYIVR
ncbi:MAG: adenylosuccinate synthase [Mycoplasmoidaceae bacterium]